MRYNSLFKALQNVASDHISQDRLLFSDLLSKSKKSAKIFQSFGVQDGDIVHICLPATTEFYYPVIGTWICNGIVSVVDPTLTLSSNVSRLEIVRPKIVVCCEDNLDIIQEALILCNLNDVKIFEAFFFYAFESYELFFFYHTA